jgi:hypothetical protein
MSRNGGMGRRDWGTLRTDAGGSDESGRRRLRGGRGDPFYRDDAKDATRGGDRHVFRRRRNARGDGSGCGDRGGGGREFVCENGRAERRSDQCISDRSFAQSVRGELCRFLLYRWSVRAILVWFAGRLPASAARLLGNRGSALPGLVAFSGRFRWLTLLANGCRPSGPRMHHAHASRIARRLAPGAWRLAQRFAHRFLGNSRATTWRTRFLRSTVGVRSLRCCGVRSTHG